MRWNISLDKKRLTIYISIGLVLAVGIFYYFFQLNKPDSGLSETPGQQSVAVAPTTMEDSVLSSFSDVRDVLDYDGFTWVLTTGVYRLKGPEFKHYTELDGLPASGSTDGIIFKDTFWVAMQGGAAKYDKASDKFIPALVGESNIEFYHDADANELYAGTFEGFFRYDPTGDKWERQTDSKAVRDPYYLVSNNKYLVATAPDTDPVIMYNKESKTWLRPVIADFTSINKQFLHLFKANGRIFVYGRSNQYDSCEDSGKTAATTFYELKGDSWQKVDSLTNKFFEFEAGLQTHFDANGKEAIFVTDPESCKEGSENRVLTKVNFEETEITFGGDSTVPRKEAVSNKEKELVTAGEMIASATKRSSYVEIQAIDDTGNVYAATSTGISVGSSSSPTSYSVFSPTSDGYAETVLATPDFGYARFDPIICKYGNKQTASHFLAREANEMSGELNNFTLYRIADKKATKTEGLSKAAVSTMTALTNKSICVEGVLYWISGDVIKKVNLNDFTLADVATVTKAEEGEVSIIAYGDKIYHYAGGQNQKLSIFDRASEKVSQFSTKIGSEVRLALVTATNLWFVSNTSQDKNVYVTDLNGALLKQAPVANYSGSLGDVNEKFVISVSPQANFLEKDNMQLISKADYTTKSVPNGILFFSSSINSFGTFLTDSKYGKTWFVTPGIGFSVSTTKFQ